ncbi:MAG: flagellar hook protein FlgE [Amnibacterium sp.]
MLRSLYAGISGLRAEQTMLDVTSNNIANVNTTGFKSSSVQFEDTLSQTLSAAGLPQATKAGTNPSQVGLGVRVAAINTNLAQGEQQSTGNSLDTMISGDGYFVTTVGTQTQYTRDGAFHWDAQGRLATSDGGLVQGWTAVNGVINTGGSPSGISLPGGTVAPAVPTSKATLTGNLDASGSGGASVKEITVYDQSGAAKTLSITFTPGTNGAWTYTAGDGTGAAVTGTLQCTNGKVTGTLTNTTSDGIHIDMSALTGFADLSTATIATQDGTAAGRLMSTTMGSDGTLSGTFSNGATLPLARLAMATFVNPEGLEKAGNSNLVQTLNSGGPTLTTAGNGSAGTIIAGALEASNVDLSQEFTNLIIAQRGFQANARIITTSDQVLQDLVQLKQ